MPSKKLQILGVKLADPETVGLSAYEIAVKNGFKGSEVEWLESLVTRSWKSRETSDLNTAIENGIYKVSMLSCLNLPNGLYDGENPFTAATLFVEINDSQNLVNQRLTYQNITVLRHGNFGIDTETGEIDTIWDEWEYVNPPYDLNVEYRTIKRRFGQAVYEKLDDQGVMWWKIPEIHLDWTAYTDRYIQ